MSVVERITKTIYSPCRGLLLKHQITFGTLDQAKKRKGELSSYNYNSTRYTDVNSLTSLIVQTNDYIILEKLNYNTDSENEKILLSYPHIFKLKRALKEALKWFYSSKFEDIYKYNNNELIFNSDYSDEKIEIYNLIGGKGIIIIPDIIDIEDVQYEGITMFLNSESNSIQFTIDQLDAFSDFFSTFDLYSASQLLTNYVTSINPDNIANTGFNNVSKGKPTSNKFPANKKRKKKTSKVEEIGE